MFYCDETIRISVKPRVQSKGGGAKPPTRARARRNIRFTHQRPRLTANMSATRTGSGPATTAEPTPGPPIELSLFGQLQGASGLAVPMAHCSWRITMGDEWRLERGEGEGSSQSATTSQDGAIVFAQPVDVVLIGTATGWPRLELEVRGRDEYDRSDLAGYAVVHVPSAPGSHQLRCPIWRPKGSGGDNLAHKFVGGAPALKDPALVYGSIGADGKGLERSGYSTVGSGFVHLLLNVCLRELPESARKKPPKPTAKEEEDDED